MNMKNNKKKIIGIDARMYHIPGGIGRYTRELISSLERIDSENEYRVFLRKEGFDNYQPNNQKFKKVLADIGWYGFSEQLKMPGIWKKEKINLLHATHFNKSLFYRRPYVVTIHDLTYSVSAREGMKISKLPPIVYEFKRIAYEWAIRDVIKKAKKIIVPTNYSKEDIVRMYKINPEKVSVTYESVTGDFSPERRGRDLSVISNKFSINKKYFIYVGNASPHKNVKRLIEAFLKFYEINNSFQLVLAGKKEKFYEQIERELIERGISRDRVILTDMVSDEELYSLLANAYALTFPSLAEGFGIPPLEAMASGIPVLVSNISCLPEICQDKALYFDPYNTDDIAEKMRIISEDENLRENLIKKGLEHVKSFSWDKMARETREVYESVFWAK